MELQRERAPGPRAWLPLRGEGRRQEDPPGAGRLDASSGSSSPLSPIRPLLACRCQLTSPAPATNDEGKHACHCSAVSAVSMKLDCGRQPRLLGWASQLPFTKCPSASTSSH